MQFPKSVEVRVVQTKTNKAKRSEPQNMDKDVVGINSKMFEIQLDLQPSFGSGNPISGCQGAAACILEAFRSLRCNG
jgi:hypothetical protein